MSIEDRIRREAEELQADWDTNPRWKGVRRDYTAEDVVRLRGSLRQDFAISRNGAERLWRQMEESPYVNALGAMTGGQAVNMVKAGLQAIYLSRHITEDDLEKSAENNGENP